MYDLIEKTYILTLILGRTDYVNILICRLLYSKIFSSFLLYTALWAVGTLLRTRKVLVIVDKKKACCCPIKRVLFYKTYSYTFTSLKYSYKNTYSSVENY